MKKYIAYLLLGIISTISCLGAQSGGAARYLSEPSKYLEKRVQIFAVGGELCPDISDNGYVLFLMRTVDGIIYLQVPEKSAKKFANGMPKYDPLTGKGNSTKSYGGIFTKVKRGVETVYAIRIR